MNSAFYSFNFSSIPKSFSICIYLSSIPVSIIIPTYLLCCHQTLLKVGKAMTNLYYRVNSYLELLLWLGLIINTYYSLFKALKIYLKIYAYIYLLIKSNIHLRRQHFNTLCHSILTQNYLFILATGTSLPTPYWAHATIMGCGHL